MSNTYIVRLTTGEEIICKAEVGDTHTKVTNPLLILPTGEGKITFATWLPYNEDDFVNILNTQIMFVITPAKQMADQYGEMTGQIVVPDSKIIT